MASAGEGSSGQLEFIVSDGQLTLPAPQSPDFPPELVLEGANSIPRPANFANLVVALVGMLDEDAEPEKLEALANETWGMEQLLQVFPSKAAIVRKVAELRAETTARRFDEQRLFRELLGVPTLLARLAQRPKSPHDDDEQFVMAIAGERYREFMRNYGGRKAANVAARYALARTFAPYMLPEPAEN